MRLLIISEEHHRSLQLQRFLEQEAFAVDRANDGRDGVYLSRVNRYDAILIQEHQTESFAFNVCAKIRDHKCFVPIIGLLSRDESRHRVAAFDAGIDDCVSCPLAFQEVLARLRAIWRRGPAFKNDVLKVAGVSLNTRNHQVRSEGRLLQLSKKEYALLELLMRNKGCVVPRMTIFESVWNMDGDPLSNAIESHISNIRKKIGKKGHETIRNVQGRGYLIDEIQQ
jgi:DNA-binding response OmpR family regulator